jgi:hypothetical protein
MHHPELKGNLSSLLAGLKNVDLLDRREVFLLNVSFKSKMLVVVINFIN